MNENKKFNDLPLFFKQKLGIDHKKITKNYNDIQKMAWEQVLLLTIYSRQYCYIHTKDRETVSFISKMKLINYAYNLCNDSNQDEKQFRLLRFVLEKLDHNKGSTDIINALYGQTSGGDDDEWIKQCKTLLSDIEKNSIAFSANVSFLNPLPLYSHHALFIGLVKPIDLFRPLLKIPQILDTKIFTNLLIEFTKCYISSEYTSSFYEDMDIQNENGIIIDDFHSVNNYYQLEKVIETHPGAIDKSSFELKFKNYLMNILAKHVEESFQTTKIPKFNKNNTRVNDVVFSSSFKINKTEGLSLDINRDSLVNLIRLGLINKVTEEIKNTLLNEINGQQYRSYNYQIPDDNYSTAFYELGAWYQSCKTNLFNKLDQVPRMVAAIIALDIKNRQGFFSVTFERLPKKLNAGEIALITTSIIHNCLYKDIPNNLLLNTAFNSSYNNKIDIDKSTTLSEMLSMASEHILDKNNETSGTNFQKYPNKLMAEWGSYKELKTAIERIKKIPNYLKVPESKLKSLIAMDNIKNQRKHSASGKYPYPINTVFPLPLWASLDSNIIKEDDK